MNIEGTDVIYTCPALRSSGLTPGNGTPTGLPSMDHDSAPVRNPPPYFGSSSSACCRPLGSAAQPRAVLRIVPVGVILPTRIVAALQQRSAEERYQLCQPRMDSGAVQALVGVLPEYL